MITKQYHLNELVGKQPELISDELKKKILRNFRGYYECYMDGYCLEIYTKTYHYTFNLAGGILVRRQTNKNSNLTKRHFIEM
jgi:hypothetical protein